MAALNNACAFALCFLLTASLAHAATYNDALQAGVAQGDIQVCDTIAQGYCIQDFCISIEQAQRDCRVAVTVAKGDPQACLKLDNRRSHPADVTPRHRCLDQMARSAHRAEICAMIPPEEESTDEKLSRARCHLAALVTNRWCPPDAPEKQAQLFRDNCRLQAISDLRQCTEGFSLPETRKRMSDLYACVLTVSANMRDASLCSALTAPDERKNCENRAKEWQKPDTDRRDRNPGGMPAGR